MRILGLIFSTDYLPALIGFCTLLVTFVVVFIAFSVSKNYMDHVKEIRLFNEKFAHIETRLDENVSLAKRNQIRHSLSLHTVTLMLAVQEAQKYVEKYEQSMKEKGDSDSLEKSKSESILLGLRMKKRQAELRYLSHIDGTRTNIINQLTYLEPDLHTLKFFETLEASCLDSEEVDIIKKAKAVIEHKIAVG